MFFSSLCIPALVYLIFMLVHVVVATFEGQYSHAILNIILGVLMTLLLQVICLRGMSLVSWIIVFIPFIFYTYMIMIIGYVFGANPERGDSSRYLVNE